jgi:hypothetical protein
MNLTKSSQFIANITTKSNVWLKENGRVGKTIFSIKKHAHVWDLVLWTLKKQLQTPWYEPASKLHRPSDRCLSAKLVPTFADRGYHVVSMTDPNYLILGFLDRSRYFFFQVAPQLYSRGWVDPVPDPLLLRKYGSAGNWTRTSGSVTRNSDH